MGKALGDPAQPPHSEFGCGYFVHFFILSCTYSEDLYRTGGSHRLKYDP